MKRSHIILLAFFSVMGVMVGFSVFGDMVVPQIEDTVSISEGIKIGTTTNDSLEIIDTTLFESNVEKKHYTINARDSPMIQK